VPVLYFTVGAWARDARQLGGRPHFMSVLGGGMLSCWLIYQRHICVSVCLSFKLPRIFISLEALLAWRHLKRISYDIWHLLTSLMKYSESGRIEKLFANLLSCISNTFKCIMSVTDVIVTYRASAAGKNRRWKEKDDERKGRDNVKRESCQCTANSRSLAVQLRRKCHDDRGSREGERRLLSAF